MKAQTERVTKSGGRKGGGGCKKLVNLIFFSKDKELSKDVCS
jgi:hypothetical protein